METETTAPKPLRGLRSPLMLSATLAAAAMAGLPQNVAGGPLVLEYKNSYRTKVRKGTNMVCLGKTETGERLFQDSYGRHYTRDAKGTIRRVKSKKA